MTWNSWKHMERDGRMSRQLLSVLIAAAVVALVAGCAGTQAPTPAPVAAPDSDGDGVPDDVDKCPNTPKGVKVNATGCWELRDVNFDSGKAVIKNPEVLDEVVDILKHNPAMTGEVRGYTDNTGTLELNRKLSEARAKSVRDYLVKQGIAPERIRARGFDPAQPVASNDTAEGRAQNRRVELHPDL